MPLLLILLLRPLLLLLLPAVFLDAPEAVRLKQPGLEGLDRIDEFQTGAGLASSVEGAPWKHAEARPAPLKYRAEASQAREAEADARSEGVPNDGDTSVQNKALSFTLSLVNVTYLALAADAVLFDGVSAAMKSIVAKEANVEPEQVAVALRPSPSNGGSTFARCRIVSHRTSLDSVQVAMCGNLQGIATQVEASLKAYPNLDSILAGDLSANVEGECRVEEEEEEYASDFSAQGKLAPSARSSASEGEYKRFNVVQVIMLINLIPSVLISAGCLFVNHLTSWRQDPRH